MIDALRALPAQRPALIDGATADITPYGALLARVDQLAAQLPSERSLGFVHALSSVDGVVAWLACLASGHPAVLLDPQRVSDLADLAATYRPAFMILAADVPVAGDFDVTAYNRMRLWRARTPHPTGGVHPDLALCLQTSGSTGSPRLVRLSAENVRTNAEAIGSYLGLDADERAMQSLPFHYSYGLSVLNSHLVRGASVVVNSASFMQREYWDAFDTCRATSFAGVPFMYETLARLNFQCGDHPTLKTMTQAGGALRAELIEKFGRQLDASGRRFFVMYGQTEATARMTYVPPERLLEKTGSVGVPIPGGTISVKDDEIVYRGPNVMMGYAACRDDLARGDDMGGILATGDLGRLDADGFLYVTGRRARFAKVFGRRVQLEDVELRVETLWKRTAIAMESARGLVVLVEAAEAAEAPNICQDLATLLEIPPLYVTIRALDSLPRTASGKKDYRGAARVAEEK